MEDIISTTVIYPNPTTGIVNLRKTDDATFLIKDASGRTVMSRKTSYGKLDLSLLENGFYVLQNNKGNVFKITILK